MFGWWAAPFHYHDPSDGANDFRWDSADYGKAFSSVRRGLLDTFPDLPLSFGLVNQLCARDICSLCVPQARNHARIAHSPTCHTLHMPWTASRSKGITFSTFLVNHDVLDDSTVANCSRLAHVQPPHRW